MSWPGSSPGIGHIVSTFEDEYGDDIELAERFLTDPFKAPEQRRQAEEYLGRLAQITPLIVRTPQTERKDMTEETAVDPTSTGVALDKKKFVRIAVVSSVAAVACVAASFALSKFTAPKDEDNVAVDVPDSQD